MGATALIHEPGFVTLVPELRRACHNRLICRWLRVEQFRRKSRGLQSCCHPWSGTGKKADSE